MEPVASPGNPDAVQPRPDALGAILRRLRGSPVPLELGLAEITEPDPSGITLSCAADNGGAGLRNPKARPASPYLLRTLFLTRRRGFHNALPPSETGPTHREHLPITRVKSLNLVT